MAGIKKQTNKWQDLPSHATYKEKNN